MPGLEYPAHFVGYEPDEEESEKEWGEKDDETEGAPDVERDEETAA